MLIFHLSNHYALIFALREWRSTNGGPAAALDDHSRETSASTSTGARGRCPAPASSGINYLAFGVGAAPSPANDEDSIAIGASSAAHASGTDEPGRVSPAAIKGTNSDGWTRQILTARRGQRPTAWIDFEEARRTMLGWEGYNILFVRRGKGRPLPLA